jgi:hypothetical protein
LCDARRYSRDSIRGDDRRSDPGESETQHTYFNLGGERCVDVLGHELHMHAERYLPVDPTLIPIGDVSRVDATPFDSERQCV